MRSPGPLASLRRLWSGLRRRPSRRGTEALFSPVVERKLERVDWSVRDVLVGSLRSPRQLDVCLKHRFYHIPAERVPAATGVRTVALYQSKRFFGARAGIRYYGDVSDCRLVRRSEIKELLKSSDALYYRFEIRAWRTLPRPIEAKETGEISFFTNRFLLEHSVELPELELCSEGEYRLYTRLRQALNSPEINDAESDLRFPWADREVVFAAGEITVRKDDIVLARCPVDAFRRTPGAVLQTLLRDGFGQGQ